MPTGPWDTDEIAKAEINSWARALGTVDRGFAVTWGSLKAGNSSRGCLHKLVCHNHAAAKTSCGWSLTLEQCAEGWVIRSYRPHPGEASGHNHPLIKTATEAMTRATMRDIPSDLVEIGKAMVLSGVANAQVYRFLRQQAEKDGGTAAFTLQDVYHKCGASTGERRLDATNLVEMLHEREQDEDLFSRTTTDSEGCLDKVFFVMKGATAIYANNVEKQMVEVDHKVRAAAADGWLERLSNALPRICSTAPTSTG